MITEIITGIIGAIIGFIVCWVVKNEKVPDKDEPVNAQISEIIFKENPNIYIDEWKTIIQTQMHFNELIIKFRTIVLTTFITLSGILLAIAKTESSSIIDKEIVPYLFAIPIILYILSFVLDYYYYNRLLIGSVIQAKKFDESEVFIKSGHFGLTACINKNVARTKSKVLIIFYYFLPIIVIVLLMLLLKIF